MPVYTRQNGAWVETEPTIRQGGGWITPHTVFANVGGNWQEVWPLLAPVTASLGSMSNQTCQFPYNGGGCANSVSVTCTAGGGDGSYSYSWSANQGATISGSGSTVTVTRSATSNATVTVTCTVTDGRGSTASNSGNFTSTHTRRPQLTASMGSLSNQTCTYPYNQSSCANSVSASVSASGGSGSYSYSWSANNGATISGSGSSVTVNRSSGSNATVTVTCVVTSDGQSVTTSQQFTSTHTQLPRPWNGTLANIPATTTGIRATAGATAGLVTLAVRDTGTFTAHNGNAATSPTTLPPIGTLNGIRWDGNDTYTRDNTEVRLTALGVTNHTGSAGTQTVSHSGWQPISSASKLMSCNIPQFANENSYRFRIELRPTGDNSRATSKEINLRITNTGSTG